MCYRAALSILLLNLKPKFKDCGCCPLFQVGTPCFLSFIASFSMTYVSLTSASNIFKKYIGKVLLQIGRESYHAVKEEQHFHDNV